MKMELPVINPELIKKTRSLLAGVKQIAVVPHSNPDGDAIGSALALYQYFKKKGFGVRVISPNEYPVFLRWLPQNSDVLAYTENRKNAAKWIRESDLIFIVDCNSFKRTGEIEHLLENHPGKKIMIDHHPDPENIADVIFSDTAVSSTCEMVYEFIKAFGDNALVDKVIAECLYTGMMTDTGVLSYNSSNPRTYYIIADLLTKGIDKNKIHGNVYDNYSADRMRLLGFCLSEKMEIIEEYRTAIISLTRDELERFNYKDGDNEGFVNYPLSIKGLVMSVMFMEIKGQIKSSFRSKGNIPVNIIARDHFNGGGHTNAAGGQTDTSIKEAVDELKKVLPQYKTFLKE